MMFEDAKMKKGVQKIRKCLTMTVGRRPVVDGCKRGDKRGHSRESGGGCFQRLSEIRKSGGLLSFYPVFACRFYANNNAEDYKKQN
jgi:hypothetical protein